MSAHPPQVSLLADQNAPAARIGELAAFLGLAIIHSPDQAGLFLRWTGSRLELVRHVQGRDETVSADFTRARFRQGPAQGEGRGLLLQAVKVRKVTEPLVIDATAGLGRDGFLLAASGYRVWMFERNRIIAALLRDGLERAARLPETAAVCSRIQLLDGDAVSVFAELPEQPEVIYLDPMFPERTKSALVKKDLQLLRLVDDGRRDGDILLRAACMACPRKVVVKRPLKGSPLDGLRPSYSLRGTTVRFDVYVGTGGGKKGQGLPEAITAGR